MDLRRLKTVFIFVLIAINVMFFALIYNALNYEREERRTMTKSLTTLLAQNMIYLSENVEIPTSPEVSGLYLEKMFGSNEEMVVRFLGKEYAEIEPFVYQNNKGRLHIDGNEFRYYNTKPKETVTDFSEKNIKVLCDAEMQNLGIAPDPYVFSGVNFVDDGVRAIFTMRHKNDEFFDAYISFDITKDGVVTVSGKNLVSDLIALDRNEKFFSIISILPDLSKNPKLSKNVAHTIVSIKPGYYIGKTSEDYRNVLAIPVWQIATDSGIILYYDARNGQSVDE